MSANTLGLFYTVKERKSLFKDLAALQDELAATMGRNVSMVRESYRRMAQSHGVSRWDLRAVEDEGIAKGWLDMDESGSKPGERRKPSRPSDAPPTP